MPSNLSTIVFAAQSGTWTLSKLPSPYNSWTGKGQLTAEGIRAMRAIGSTQTEGNTSNYMTRGILAMLEAEGTNPDPRFALLDNNGDITIEYTHASTAATDVVSLTSAGIIRGCRYDAAGNWSALPPLSEKGNNNAAVVLAIFCHLLRYPEVADLYREVVNNYQLNGMLSEDHARDITNVVYHSLKSGGKMAGLGGITAGSVTPLTDTTIKSGAVGGTIVYGKPKYAAGTVTATASAGIKEVLFKEAKDMFKSFADTHSWSAEEEELIPTFPDDYPVPQEAIRMASLYIGTKGTRRPMVNFLWRGITSYGKSTGVEMLAAMLRMPLVRMTCSSTMETQDFLSTFVPCSSTAALSATLPTFDDMNFDPESSYEMMTGTKKDGATQEDCLAAYANAVAERAVAAAGKETSKSLFKVVESNYVKALRKGWIVEVQEMSRIRDAGVLVGLNEFDRAGARIPMVDGTSVTRHVDSIVIYTDNVGYVSCKPVDPSVLRRCSVVFDSYEIPKETALARVRYNTGFDDDTLLETMYDTWQSVADYCAEKDISDGSISLTELEMWAACVKADGYSHLLENARSCVVAKATSDISEQKEIMSTVINIKLAGF